MPFKCIHLQIHSFSTANFSIRRNENDRFICPYLLTSDRRRRRRCRHCHCYTLHKLNDQRPNVTIYLLPIPLASRHILFVIKAQFILICLLQTIVLHSLVVYAIERNFNRHTIIVFFLFIIRTVGSLMAFECWKIFSDRKL